MGRRKYSGMDKLRDGRYRKRFTVNGERYTVYGFTAMEAEEAAYQRRKEIEAGEYKKKNEYSKNDAVTLNEYFAEWIDRRAGSLSPHAIFMYKSIYKNHVQKSRVGKSKVKQIERRELIALQSAIARKGTVYTANRALVLLHGVFKAAVLDEIIMKNPADGIPRMKITKQPSRETIHRALTEEETKLFLEAAAGTWYYNAFRFMLVTGLRVGELGALQWNDVDFKNGVLHIRRTVTRNQNGVRIVGEVTKTKSSRRDIPISGDISAILAEQRRFYADLHGDKVLDFSGRIFEASNGGLVDNSVANVAIKAILRRINKEGQRLAYFSVHAFRDTFATLALIQGMEPNTLKEILGHSSLAMTMDLYAHVLDSEKKKAMDGLQILSVVQ